MPRRYPSAGQRIKAAVFDGVVLLLLWLALALLLKRSTLPPGVRVPLLFAPALYEPLLVSLRGQTLGHARHGLLVVRAGSGGRVNILLALVRWITKVVLGWYSLLLMMFTARRQAVHDAVSSTVVVDDYLPPEEVRRYAVK